MSRPPFPSGWSSIPLNPRNLTLANTLPVGQSFLWHRHSLPSASQSTPSEEFSRAVDDPPRVVCLRQSPSHLYYTAIHCDELAAKIDREKGSTRRWLDDYFQFQAQPDLEALYAEWKVRDPALFGKVEVDGRAIGVRVLRQDPWECLIAFITSTNNHIPRITSLLHRFSEAFSPPILNLEHPSGHGSTTHHLFPAPHLIPSKLESILREMGFGYRASFIESSLESLRAEFGSKPGNIEAGLMTWRAMDVDLGVGRKVADCVMLMCLDKPSLIPIDTHLTAIAARHPSFPLRLRNKPMSKLIYDETQEFLLDKWGPLGGWCQAVMFAADLPQAQVKVKKEKIVVTQKASTPVKRPLENDFITNTELKRTRSATRLHVKRSTTVNVKEEEIHVKIE
nr:uncharacterized protein CI109_001788 [Kwoniella shandongensis]KAA5529848.1 hypothetical protein CI109_001788 [Kwoniella shandongensis]